MTQEHREVRSGKATASQVSRLLADPTRPMTKDELEQWKIDNPKSKATTMKDENMLSDGAITYCFEIASEICTGLPIERVPFKETEWGNENEPKAFARFAKEYPELNAEYFGIENPQFFHLMDFEGFAGGSPDGLAKNIVLEIKCPYNSAVHLKNCMISDNAGLESEHPDYYAQIQMNMMCTDSESGLFISYDPRQLYKPLHVIHVLPDLAMQEKIRKKITLAKTFVSNIVAQSKNKTKLTLC